MRNNKNLIALAAGVAGSLALAYIRKAIRKRPRKIEVRLVP